MKSTFCDGITRRDFLTAGAIGGLSLTLTDYLRLSAAETAKKAKADACLFLNLGGGVSHLDTLDMKPAGPAENKGPFQPIQSNMKGLPVCEHLPEFAKIADKFCLMRGMSHTSGAHPQGQSYISTGNRPVPALVYPSYGSVITKELKGRPDIPSYVAIPNTEWNPGYMGDAYAPFKTSDSPKPGKPFAVRGISLGEGMTLEKVNRREELLARVNRRFREVETDSQLLEALDKFGKQAHQMITSKHAQAAFDVSREKESLRKLFAGDELSQGLLLGCRLIEFGVKFVTVTNQGWDTHTENFTGHQRLLGPLDAAIPALMSFLEQKGMLERTLVVIMGEFGRTPRINENTGRDHWPRASWLMMAGGGVKTAQLIGGTDSSGSGPDDSTHIKPDDVAASIYHALGIDHLKEYYTNTGRPVMLVPHGKVIPGLFA